MLDTMKRLVADTTLKSVLIVFISTLIGCSSVPSREASKPDCCNSIHDFPIVPITPGTEIRLEVSANSPRYKFSDSTTHFVAIGLPSKEENRLLRIKTYVNGIWMPSATVLIPQLMLFDSERKPIRTITDLKLIQKSDFWLGGYWEAAIPLKSGEQYAAIYGATPENGKYIPRYDRSTGYAFSTGSSFVFVPGGERVWNMEYSRTGVLRVTAE